MVGFTAFSGHSHFRDSLNCGAPSMNYMFHIVNFLFEVQKASSHLSGLNGQGVTKVACIDLRDCSKWSLGCARVFLESLLDLL